MIGDPELQREARRVLRRLLIDGTVLARDGGGSFVVYKSGKISRPVMRASAEIVAGFRARDWIAPRGTTPESFVVSAPGTAWYLRTLADGDPFAAQHQLRTRRIVVDPDGAAQDVVVNEAESPLTRLRTRRLIDATQLEAGERLRRDYTIAHLGPRMGVDLTAPVVVGGRSGQGGPTLGETALAARQRFSRAMAAAGPGLNDLLFDVCCHFVGLEDAERSFGWPSRAGRVVLTIALDRLALHYGMRVLAPHQAAIRSWQAS
jgi:hypothetical protein